MTLPVLRVAAAQGTSTVSLASLGRDARRSVVAGDWVEVVDDDYALRSAAAPLLAVEDVDRDDLEVELSGVVVTDTATDRSKHPFLRRWDHDGTDGEDGALLVVEGSGDDGWVELEDGVIVQFGAAAAGRPAYEYRTGDYWLVPARTATGDVLWPQQVAADGTSSPAPRPPAGIEHVYAPLAAAALAANGKLSVDSPDCRFQFPHVPYLGG